VSEDPRLDFPATGRNSGPLLEALGPTLPSEGPVHLLEVASGSGQHGAFLCEALPQLVWWPSDLDPAHRASVDAWRAHTGLPNLRPAAALDVCDAAWRAGDPRPEWPAHFDRVFCANMIHIAPWAACEGLIEGAARRLGPGAELVLYGPFLQEGVETAESNLAFDASLRGRDPRWGVRALEAVAALATTQGFGPPVIQAMPANNLLLRFERLP